MDTRLSALFTHLRTKYKHYQLLCEHSILPIHLLAIGHFYSAATLVAGAVTVIYLLAVLAKGRA